jgi:hypothetical protein
VVLIADTIIALLIDLEILLLHLSVAESDSNLADVGIHATLVAKFVANGTLHLSLVALAIVSSVLVEVLHTGPTTLTRVVVAYSSTDNFTKMNEIQ